VEDTAQKVGTVDDCLYSLENRVKIARLLSSMQLDKLLDTELEDIYYFCQSMFEEYSIVRDPK